MKDADELRGNDSQEYVSVGYFDPLLSKRIMKRLTREHIRFAARDASGVGMAGAEVPYAVPLPLPYPILHRLNRVELLVHTSDASAAHAIIGEV